MSKFGGRKWQKYTKKIHLLVQKIDTIFLSKTCNASVGHYARAQKASPVGRCSCFITRSLYVIITYKAAITFIPYLIITVPSNTIDFGRNYLFLKSCNLIVHNLPPRVFSCVAFLLLHTTLVQQIVSFSISISVWVKYS